MNPRSRFVLLTIAAVFAIGVTASLGRWQLARASYKLAQQAAVEAQSSKPELDAKALQAATTPLQWLHQRARIKGVWVPGKTVFLDQRQMEGRVGFFAMTPFRLQDGGAVLLVQRGWVPRNFTDRSQLPAIETPQGVVEIAGRIAPPPAKLFELGASPPGVIRQNLDLAQFAQETELALLPVTLLQTGAPSEGLLRDWPAVQLGVDKHYGYAFQWFGLAALIAALYLWFQFFRRFIFRSKDPASHAE